MCHHYDLMGYDYSSGVWQFEAYGYVPCGTSGVCVMQVFGSSPRPHATTLMVRVYNDSPSYYRAPVLVPNIYDTWFRLTVIHDVEASNVKAPGRGGKSHYFKCTWSLCTEHDGSNSYYMESRCKEIKVLKK
ncbi:hypothetical protein CIPAW_04G087300 [Carya illinoinensis]|uniref:Uncharacterized protein n=1 Tax=Carya illinoinensis TaxID=32201 RepID=A0A8T1QS61_CARIL|nr:hypothetical protein CIPAW_04G087300 [Carya illinoinensis]